MTLDNYFVRECRYRRRVNFYETDMAGIVHFSCFFRYMEEAEHALWRQVGLSVHLAESNIGWPRVSTSFDFYHPLRFEDEFEVWLRVAVVAQRTISYKCVITKGAITSAAGSVTVACALRRLGEPIQPIA